MRQNTTRRHSLPYIVRASWPPFLIFSAFGVVMSLSLLSIVGRGSSTFLPVLLIFCVIWVVIGSVLFWLASYKITLFADRICYRHLFSSNEMPFTDINYVELQVLGRGGYILAIRNHTSSNPLFVSLKPFSKRDISIVIDVIATYAPRARLNDGARQLRQGTFKG